MKKELIEWMKSHRVHTAAAAVLIIGAFSASVAAASGAFLPEESGTTGGKTPSRVMEITAKDPNVSDETKKDTAEDEAKTKEKEKKETNTSQADKKADSSSSSDSGSTSKNKVSHSGSSTKTSSSSGSGSSSAGSSTAGASSSGSNSSSSQASKPAHTHQWKDHTAKRWVSNWVTVVDTPEQTVAGARFYTQNADGTWTANGDTYWIENGFTWDDLKAIIKEKLQSGDMGYANYQNISKTVPAVTHQEDQGHYETFVDYQYCSCGATR